MSSFSLGTFSLTAPHITGTTPPPISCPNTLCQRKVDGNYEIADHPNYFVQCIGGLAHCQACWPLSLSFSGKCNQCLYNRNDECVTTKKWQPAATYYCPDVCPERGSYFQGNVEDPGNSYQYVACWNGITVGCVACPAGLQFNEAWNACLFEGKYKTQRIQH